MKKVFVIQNRYVDSVMLMGVSERLASRDGVQGAESGMGTPANVELLTSLGYTVPDGITKNDLMIAVEAPDEAGIAAAYQAGLDTLDHRGAKKQRIYHDLNELEPGSFDIAQISLPGEYAADEIKKAILLGMDVFVFSDNVSLAEEREVKELGRKYGKLVMGPDAGVGLIGGIALAAGSIVRPGGVGIVAASGSGAQEVACILEHMGAGVSEIIGTGGHDLLPQIGGITMRMGMDRLSRDGNTKVICLVSKLADETVMAGILDDAETLDKPVVAVFLGGSETLFAGRRTQGAQSLEEAAELCYQQLTGEEIQVGWPDSDFRILVKEQLARITPERRYFRGLYCGGTFTEEALILFHRQNPQVPLYSNLSTSYAHKLLSHHQSTENTILDMGAEDFTAEAPHPVFDPALRIQRLEQELADPRVAVVLLDFITGPGMSRNPILPFVPIIRKHPEVVFITAICGAKGDPQNIEEAQKALAEAGAMVAKSNRQSARLAATLMAELDRRSA